MYQFDLSCDAGICFYSHFSTWDVIHSKKKNKLSCTLNIVYVLLALHNPRG